MIDADSFQIKVNGNFYPCVVGKEGYTPPELFGKDLATTERSIAQDNFSLAVAIFHLLFMGKHPYAGVRNGPDTSMGQDIADNRFAYSILRETQTKPPPGALTLDLFPETVSKAFEDAFGLSSSSRPSALDWIHALSKLEGSLRRCSKVKTHYYPSAAKSCVWCNLTARSGLDMFPDLSAVTSKIATDARGTEQAIREILTFRFPTVDDLLPAVSVRSTSSALRDAKGGKRGRALLGLLMMGGAVAGFILAAPAFFVWIGLAIWGWSTFNDREVSTSPFIQAYKDADEKIQRELNAFVQRNGLTEVVKVRSELDAAITAYTGHDDALAREVTILKSNRESRQRQAYLDRFSIRRASISGIGPAKTATLISFGIETAADVNRSAILRVPGFGDVMSDKLVAWRRRHEARFKYDRTPNAQDVADERALRGRFATEKAKLESTIRNGLGTLRNARAKLDTLAARAKNDQALSEALTARAQAECDLKDLGVFVPVSTVTLTVAPPARSALHSFKTARGTNKSRSPKTSVSIVPDCPYCGRAMVKRTARRGRNAGGKFWGCSGYPYCKGTRNLSGKSRYSP